MYIFNNNLNLQDSLNPFEDALKKSVFLSDDNLKQLIINNNKKCCIGEPEDIINSISFAINDANKNKVINAFNGVPLDDIIKAAKLYNTETKNLSNVAVGLYNNYKDNSDQEILKFPSSGLSEMRNEYIYEIILPFEKWAFFKNTSGTTEEDYNNYRNNKSNNTSNTNEIIKGVDNNVLIFGGIALVAGIYLLKK